MINFYFSLILQYDIPTYMGMLEEEVKDELMDTDVPSEGENCQCTCINNYPAKSCRI